MSGPLILVVMIVYFLIGVDFFLKANYPMAVVFVAYGIANLGLYLVK